MRKLLVMISVLVVVASACSSTPEADPLVAVRASSDLAVGDDRLLFALHEIDGRRRGSPEDAVSIVASPLDTPSKKIEADAEFAWIVDSAFGLYVVHVPFDEAGTWQIDLSISTGEPAQPLLVDVQAEPRTVGVGESAPSIETPTAADAAITDLTTDHDPLEPLYEMSLDVALGNGRKTVVLFATPAYCTSATCGPLLDHVKTLSGQYSEVDFIHIEVYEGFNEPDFAPDADHLVPAVVAFGLPSEPWIFVMDSEGVVTGRFDGVLGEGEIEALLES